MPAQTLFVIEAPGKRQHLASLLNELRLPARVIATGGHIAAFPADPHILGITITGDTPGREWKPAVKDRLLREFSSPDVKDIIVATDNDDEGDVIAHDIATLAQLAGKPAKRLRMNALTLDALRSGLQHLSDIREEDAAPGRTRAMIDRVLGIGLSGEEHGAGRILTPLLALAAAGDLTRLPVRLVLPAANGGMPFEARGWLTPEEIRHIQSHLSSAGLPSLRDAPEPAPPSLAGTGELLVRLGEEQNHPPETASRILQALYESGRMSYCRADRNPLPRHSIALLARSAGYASLPRLPASAPEATGRIAHPAPHPLIPLSLASDLERLPDDLAALTVVGRAQAEALLQDWRAGDAPEWHRWWQCLGGKIGIWTRPLRPVGRLLPWLRRREPGMDLLPMPMATRVVASMLRHKLGRPSTYAEHAERFIGRGLLREDGTLSAKGRRWLAAAPSPLRDPAFSHQIEIACREATPSAPPGTPPWKARFSTILAHLPAEVRHPVLAALRSQHTQNLLQLYQKSNEW